METLSASLLALPAFVVAGLALTHLCVLADRTRGAPAPSPDPTPWPWRLGRAEYEAFRRRLAAKVGPRQPGVDLLCAGPLHDRFRR